MTHRCHPMLFVYFPALLPLTQVRSRNINEGDRKDADTAEGGPNRINRVPGKDSYLIDAITDVAIRNSRVKNRGTHMQLPVLFLRKLHHLVVLSDIHEAHRRRDLRCCWRYPYRAGQHDQKKSDNLYVAG